MCEMLKGPYVLLFFQNDLPLSLRPQQPNNNNNLNVLSKSRTYIHPNMDWKQIIIFAQIYNNYL